MAVQPTGIKALVAQRNALIALCRYLAGDRTGGVLGTALEMLVKVLGMSGGLVYRAEGDALELVSEHGLPLRAKPALAQLPLGHDNWFIAQRVATSMKAETTTAVAASHDGKSIRQTLEGAGWHAAAAAPLRSGRHLLGVLVLCSRNAGALGKDLLMMLEAVGGVLGMALTEQRAEEHDRDEQSQKTSQGQLTTLGLLAPIVSRAIALPLATMERDALNLNDIVNAFDAQPATPMSVHSVVELREISSALATQLDEALEYLRRLLALSAKTTPRAIDLSGALRNATGLVEGRMAELGIDFLVHNDGADRPVDGRQEEYQLLLVQLLLYAAHQSTGAEDATLTVHLSGQAGSHQIEIGFSDRSGHLSNTQIFDGMTHRGRESPEQAGFDVAQKAVASLQGHIEVGRTGRGPVLRVVLPVSKQREARPPSQSFETLEVPDTQREAALPLAPADLGMPESLPPADSVAAADSLEFPLPSAPIDSIDKPSLLWVDEDELFVQAAVGALDSHTIYAAANLGEARELLARIQPTPDLVLCGVHLSDGGGIELHAEVDGELASRFVFLTGGLIDENTASYLKSSGCPTLIQPISIDDVRDLLEGRDRTSMRSIAPTLGASSEHNDELGSAPGSAPGSEEDPDTMPCRDSLEGVTNPSESSGPPRVSDEFGAPFEK